MRKVMPMLLTLLLCMSLWGCGTAEKPVEETAVVPAESQSASESTEPSEPDGKEETQSLDDGSWAEIRRNEEGKLVSIHDNPETGEHIEMEFFDNFMLKRSSSYFPEMDRYSEVEYYENGNEKWASAREPSTGFTSEQEYYENGNRKYIKTCDPQMEREIQYNEDGYCTYSRCINYRDDGSAYYEIECFGDEAGNLVKVIENGEEITDKKFLSDRVGEYHFRQ